MLKRRKMKISKKKIKQFLDYKHSDYCNQSLYVTELDAAIEVIQDFLNCDPLDIGKLQAGTFDYINNVKKKET
jgi:hypothetical protein